MRVADEAASVQTRVRQEHERIVQQLVSQRAHFDASAGVLRRELEAVHEENDRLLVNFQRVAAERDALRRDLEKAETLARQQLDVDSSVVAARELRRQIADATASSQADASRAQLLERDLIRARDDITNLRVEVERNRAELAERDAKLQAARRDLEISKRSAGQMDQLQEELERAQRQLREMMNQYDVANTDTRQLGAFIDEVDSTTAELTSMAHETASYLSPVPVTAPSLSANAASGSPRRDTIKQRLAELRGLLRWIHSTLGEIIQQPSSSVERNNRNQTQQQQQPRMPSIGSTANQNSRFSLVGTSSAGIGGRGGGGLSSLRDISGTSNVTLRDFSAERVL
jgi:chromosome segregation ATPase